MGCTCLATGAVGAGKVDHSAVPYLRGQGLHVIPRSH
jgi:hypothetical protein